jgi:hypothetical protein
MRTLLKVSIVFFFSLFLFACATAEDRDNGSSLSKDDLAESQEVQATMTASPKNRTAQANQAMAGEIKTATFALG